LAALLSVSSEWTGRGPPHESFEVN